MADDKVHPGAQDDNPINLNEEYEVRYWTEKFGVGQEELQRAVERVGTSPKAVELEIRLTRTTD